MDSSGQMVMKKEDISEVLAELTEKAKNHAADPELKKQALCVLEENEQNEHIRNSAVYVGGALMNNTKEILKLYADKKWHGSFSQDIPKSINYISYFYQAATSETACEAGVVYEGKSRKGIHCGWLVAWSDSKAGKKVYCDCGVINKFKNIDWWSVKEKLNKSKDQSTYEDPETGTMSSAIITGTTTVGAVAAYFKG